ncbi:serine/threonine protein kinase [Nitrosomonas sp. Nm84]|uniref:serine/threonine-protein kinase n=1 Tax=Nitrosomonas sp. Nm84 TaxID=200124 RepID=UPI000D7712D2|nr:serine/threonine-protein kinase [Nitrosomonas sp. Nm84]PXW82657.1 serine/threonine protein kinase [Nitrosomonas sp. Nm84]
MTANQPPGDHDLTILAQETVIGSQTSMPREGHVLPIGTALGEFEITDIIGWGGFGIVYLVYDHSLQRQVALKEYMPSSFAMRNNQGEISLKSESNREIFQAGLRSFINEARLLAHFDHPSLVKVYRFWENNGTAYMVMPFYQGITLKEKIRNTDKPPDEKWLKDLLFQLLDALSVLHKDKPPCLHRDISPDNILILPEGRALLLDFGAARRVISDMTQSLTVILKPGYAPIEQYAEEANLTQGPWTDIYALAAVIYFVITRKAPTPSVSRLVSDKLIPLSEFAKNQYSIAFLKGIDKALAVRPEHRPKNVDEFRRLLGITQQQPIFGDSNTPDKPVSNKGKFFAILSAITIISFIAMNLPWNNFMDSQQTSAKISPTYDRKPTFIESAQFDPIRELETIFNARDRDHAVTISIDKVQVTINKDQLHFKIRSAKPGYVYILAVGTDQSDFLLLFPNAKDQNNHITANQQIGLPRNEWRMIAGGPPGTNHFIAIVSNYPRSFSHTALQKVNIFETFSSNETKELYRSYKGTLPFFAGQAICPSDLASGCQESYGAALFSIEEIKI